MARRRLTARERHAADDKTPYPGSINQEGRAEEGRGSMTYRTFEPSAANHEGVDYGNVHGGDKHNEIGFGIPDPASGTLITGAEYQEKCLKAAELAELFLGEKINERHLLAQARDFLALDNESLTRAIERFNRTEHLYTAEEKVEEKVEEKKEEPKACVSAEEKKEEKPVEKKEEPKVAEKETKAEEKKEEKVEEKPAEKCASKARALNLARLAAKSLSADKCTRENIVEQTKKFASLSDEQLALSLTACGEQPCVEEKPVAPGINPTPAVVPAPAPAVTAPEAKPAPAPVATEQNDIQIASDNGIDIASFDFNTSLSDNTVAANASADAELASIFRDPMFDGPVVNAGVDPVLAATQELMGNVKTASKKVGVQSLGSNVTAPVQSIVASNDNSLETLWRDAPDINGLFG